MLRGLWKLTWIEFKVFMREPMGFVSTLIFPVAIFVMLGRLLPRVSGENFDASGYIANTLPALITIVIAISGVTSLTAIMAIYREGGILRRLKATPLHPHTILTAHVLVKLIITAINIGSLLLVGKVYFDVSMQGSAFNFLLAATLSTVCILSMGFVIASVVSTARFAQLIASAILYPLLAVASVEAAPAGLRLLSSLSPITHAMRLTKGMWEGGVWGDHLIDVAALGIAFAICLALSSRFFRWE